MSGRHERARYTKPLGWTLPKLKSMMRAMLSPDLRHDLLRHARAAVLAAAEGTQPPLASASLAALTEHHGVFVTLTAGGRLRGCIGCFGGDEPLPEIVARMARQAALNDPRFPAMSPDEVAGLRVSISVLTPRSPCDDPCAIEVGRHGVSLQRGSNHGVFLPEVAVNQGWDRDTLLAQLGRKAGLDADAWRHPHTDLRTFEALVFKEPS